ncbi:MAG TPA: hypothetical protein VG889_15635 [Rhizomicrobium sp.]|nr:hypothetical protein [Rhizomicrobium sp.]
MVTTRVLGGLLLAAATVPAYGFDLGDWPTNWNLSPYTTTIGDNLQFKLTGQADGSAYAAAQPGFADWKPDGATGAANIGMSLERDYDSGLTLALKSSFEVYHDRLSGDNYGSDFVQKVYGQMQTGLGRVEIGNTDGAAYALAVTGPVVQGFTSIDNPNVTFFRDPSTGQAFVNVFALNSAVEASLNYAKISYYTPRLFGIQLGMSFTPSEGKDVIPFATKGPDVFDRQSDIWEIGASYNNYFGPVTVNFSGGFSVGHDDRKTPGHAGLTDWSLGAEIDYAVDDDWKLAVGGAWRQSNAYAFAINDVLGDGQTVSKHLSGTITHGSWIVGGELGDGKADGGPHTLGSDPTLGLHAASATLGYVVNSNLQINLGWERFIYRRDIGAFYNGAKRIGMHATFLNFEFKV